MRTPIVAGNWKMFGSLAENQALLSALNNNVNDIDPVRLFVFPPSVYLSQAQSLLNDSVIAWGAQNMSANENGAYTGEVSATMLKDFGCQAVIIGHSERRTLYGEDNTQVALKFAQAKQHQLMPILCVGESQAEREAGVTEQVVFEQIEAVLQMNDGVNAFRDACIAYEPIWAIGTGLTASPEQAQTVHAAIRQRIAKEDADIAQSIPILYGGSVKAANAKNLFAMTDIDGGLIGGASLHADEFIEIAQCMKSFF